MIAYAYRNPDRSSLLAFLQSSGYNEKYKEDAERLLAVNGKWVIACDGERIVGMMGVDEKGVLPGAFVCLVHPSYVKRGVADHMGKLLRVKGAAALECS